MKPKYIVEFGNKKGMHSSHSFSSIKQATKFASSLARVLTNSNMFSGCAEHFWEMERYEWRIEWVSNSHFIAMSRTDHNMGDACVYLWVDPETTINMKTRTIYEQNFKKAPK